MEGATDKFTGDEACRIYLQAAIVYERVRLTVFRRVIGSIWEADFGIPWTADLVLGLLTMVNMNNHDFKFMPKWMSGFVVKRLTTKAIMAAKKHSIQGELIWLTGKIRSCSLCNFSMFTWLCNNQFKNIKSLSTSLLTDWNRLIDFLNVNTNATTF